MARWTHTVAVWTTVAAFALQPVLAQAQSAIGSTNKVINSVQGALDANVRELRIQDGVFSNERIDTGPDSAARLIFEDQTILSIGANSNVVLDKFVFDPDPAKSEVSLSITKGVLRFASGNLPSRAYMVRTPTALIGIRGTIFELVVAANGATTVSVVEGAVAVSAAGTTTTVGSGLSSTVAPGAGPTPPAPSPPSPPSVQAMNNGLGPEPGQVASTSESGAGGAGGLSAGALAAGAAIAAALAALAIAVASDDDDAASTSTSTSTATSAESSTTSTATATN